MHTHWSPPGALRVCAGAPRGEALATRGGDQKVLGETRHVEQTQEHGKRQVQDVSEAGRIATSVSLVFLNMLQEDHFSPKGFAVFHEQSVSLCHCDESPS